MPWELVNDRPIYLQLAEQLELRIISGIYKTGEKIPSVRELAAEAAVNPNTMQKALASLEEKELVTTQRGTGRNVTENTELINNFKQQIAKNIIDEFLLKMKAVGYSEKETLEYIFSYTKQTVEGDNTHE